MRSTTPAAYHVDGYVQMRFLPMLFAHDYVRAEYVLFTYAGRFLSDYNGSEWTSVILASGGGFMQPADKNWQLNHHDGSTVLTISAEAAGIILTAMVLKNRSRTYRNTEPELYRHFTRRLGQLMAYAEDHVESDAIIVALN